MMIFIGIWLVLGILMMFLVGYSLTQDDFEDVANEEYARQNIAVPVWFHQTVIWLFILSQLIIWPYSLSKIFTE